MKQISLEELLEAGCHFGHQVTRQNPKAREYVFESRDNINIIDLGKTKEGLEDAAKFLLETAKKPESTLLIIGTKRQAQPILEEELKRITDEGKKDLGLFTVTKKWVGGMLTNYSALGRNYARLKELKEKLNSDEWKQKYTKKELVLFEREMEKLFSFYGGISTMKKMPEAVFIVDTHTEDLAVKEARRMKIPVVGIVDTNANPDLVDYVIPANDDAVGSLKLLIGYILDSWNEGKTAASHPEEAVKEPKTESPKKEVKAEPAKKTASKRAAEAPVVEGEKSPKKTTKTTKTGKEREATTEKKG
ncbi:MAG TPA: 30S ribosomal protein S2 [Candidatus Saccharimonadales bacterium]|nr:30S ribosomal protein S2 [Candidatus Saccharimonadales bacterium]